MARPRRVEAPVTRPLDRRNVLASRLHGMPTVANNWLDGAPIPEPPDGEALVRVADPLGAAP